MSSELETGLEAYAELESEVEPAPATEDDTPVYSQPSDWTISTLRDQYDNGWLILQPDYQREYVWDLKPELRSRLIESLLLQIPIPPIYLGQLPDGKLEVIDGQQRITTTAVLAVCRSSSRMSQTSSKQGLPVISTSVS